MRLEVFVDDLDRFVDFYTRVLGFTVTDDRRRTTHPYVAAVRDEHGTVTHYVAAQDDLSKLRSAEEQLRTLAGQLQSTLLPSLPSFPEVEVTSTRRSWLDEEEDER